MKTELGQSVDHFKRAAALAAQETGASVGPTWSAAKGRVQPAAVKAKGVAWSGWDSALATLTPLVTAATENARQTGKVNKKAAKKAAKQNTKSAKKLEKRVGKAMDRPKSRRGSKALGWALLGTAVGVGAAYASKRRRAAQWDEYDPATPVVADQPIATFEPTGTPNTTPASTTQVSTTPASTTPASTSPNGTLPDTAAQPNTPR
jgi:hypothetical protein